MRYFTYLADQSFKTAPTGERLFYRSGPWSKPYVIPDKPTEERLYSKQVWMLRFLLGGLILGQPFLFMIRPQILHEPYWFLAYFALIVAVFWLIKTVIFRRDLRDLKRYYTRLPVSSFYAQMASRHTTTGLLGGLIASLLFVVGGTWMLSTGANLAVGILCIGFFGLCTLVWGYALYLKLHETHEPQPREA